jgi:hypothetical protein
MKRFSEFSKEQTPLEGDKIKLDDILNKEIIVCGYKIGKSKYQDNDTGKYVTIQIKLSEADKPMIVFTGSSVLCQQIEKYETYIPFQTVIRKFNRYYSFT